jgi:hypothetical protein
MIVRLSIAACLVASAIMLAPHSASAQAAGPYSSPLGAIAAESGLVEPVQWGRCRYWRRVCAERWGWRTPRFFACMGRHAC